ncbi:hypothetical protein ACUWEX_11085 [Okibacterium fritillariae]|uniref:hypothetical protein n=1 Tax=Okibacterium fritillariae TaxID=123320 RepID=UPI0040555B80
MDNQLTITYGALNYILSKTYQQLGSFKWSKKATYELTPPTSRHGATKNDIARVLCAKFGMTHQAALDLIAELDKPAEAAPVRRVHTGAPDLGHRGIPTRPFAPAN